MIRYSIPMKAVICKECGYSIDDKETGTYYCPNCEKETKFYRVQAFCGSKPNELNISDE